MVASAGDNLADAWRTVAPHLRDSPGAEVLVVGLGSIGLYAVGIARALGASRVDYLDTVPARLALAESLGARPLEGPPPERVGEYGITVDASFDPAGLACALRSLAPGGVCTSIGVYFTDPPMPLFSMWRQDVRFHTGRANCRAYMPHVLDLVQAGRVQPERITSEVVRWEDAADALAEPSMKPLIAREPAYGQ
jgi:threonine dehydrogenase-like Zn-dependent dehydrogenase